MKRRLFLGLLVVGVSGVLFLQRDSILLKDEFVLVSDYEGWRVTRRTIYRWRDPDIDAELPPEEHSLTSWWVQTGFKAERVEYSSIDGERVRRRIRWFPDGKLDFHESRDSAGTGTTDYEDPTASSPLKDASIPPWLQEWATESIAAISTSWEDGDLEGQSFRYDDKNDRWRPIDPLQ